MKILQGKKRAFKDLIAGDTFKLEDDSSLYLRCSYGLEYVELMTGELYSADIADLDLPVVDVKGCFIVEVK